MAKPAGVPGCSLGDVGLAVKPVQHEEGDREFSVKKGLEQKSKKGGRFEAQCNDMLKDAAANFNIVQAEIWANKLAKAGKPLQIESFDLLLRAYCHNEDLEGAEKWFSKVKHPMLHPELGGLQPEASSFNIMVVAFADRGNVPVAEYYAKDAATLEMSLCCKACASLVNACLKKGDVRRAHLWMEASVENGFKKFNKEVMRTLIHDLTDLGNLASATRWITYMAEMGQPMDSETYAHLRAVHPLEVMPCKLSGECGGDDMGPPGVRPVRLCGEESEPPPLLRPIRPASINMPPRSPRPRDAAAHWPTRLVLEVRQEATKKMSPPLKAEFLKACSGHDVAGNMQQSPETSPRRPKHRYIKGMDHHLVHSFAGSSQLPDINQNLELDRRIKELPD